MEFQPCTFMRLVNLGFKDKIFHHYMQLNDQAFLLSPDWDRYYQLDELDMLKCYAAISEGKLVGYATFLINKGLHYNVATFAYEDLYWLDEKYRVGWNGYNFCKFMVNDLSKQADKIIVGVKTKLDVSSVWKRLGFTEFETLYQLKTNR